MKHPLMLVALLLALLLASNDARAQSSSDSARTTRPDTTARRPQAKAPPTQPFGAEAFGRSDGTTLRWLGMAGFLINSRGRR